VNQRIPAAVDALLSGLDENRYMAHVDTDLSESFTIRGSQRKPGDIAAIRTALKAKYAADPARAIVDLGPAVQGFIDSLTGLLD